MTSLNLRKLLDDSITKYVKKYSINQVLGGTDHNTKRVTTGLGFAVRIVSFIDILRRKFSCRALGSVTGIPIYNVWIHFLGNNSSNLNFLLNLN